jgi:hypothetical protein
MGGIRTVYINQSSTNPYIKEVEFDPRHRGIHPNIYGVLPILSYVQLSQQANLIKY